MAIFQSANERHQADLDEEYLYGVVAIELKNGSVSPGLAAKALAEAGGDEQKADAIYIKLRVAMLRSERAAAAENAQVAILVEKAQQGTPAKATLPQRTLDGKMLGKIFRHSLAMAVMGAVISLYFEVLGRIFVAVGWLGMLGAVAYWLVRAFYREFFEKR